MGLMIPMITRAALGRNDLIDNYGTQNFVRPPINDLGMLMSGPGAMLGSGMNGGMMNGMMGGINQSTVNGFVAGAAVGAIAGNAMQNGGLNGGNIIDHPQNNYPNNNYSNQPQNNFPNNNYNNQPQNNFPNNYNNQPQNNFPNNNYNNQPQNNFPNNSYNNQPQNNFPNNNYNNQSQNNFPNNSYNNQPQNNFPNNNYQPVRNTPNNNFGVVQPVNNSNASYASNPVNSQPVVKRKRAAATGDTLSKGQKYSIKDRDGIPLTDLKICLGWDIKDGRCELDASAFMLGQNGKVPGDEWFIFYGQPDSPENSVHYKVFKDDPNSPDDAMIELDLARVDQRVEKIAFAVTIYEASRSALHFGMVENLYARILDRRTNREIASFKMNECYSTVTAMVLGELYRYKGEWKFNAVGSGVNKDLAQFCGMYGVALE